MKPGKLIVLIGAQLVTEGLEAAWRWLTRRREEPIPLQPKPPTAGAAAAAKAGSAAPPAAPPAAAAKPAPHASSGPPDLKKR